MAASSKERNFGFSAKAAFEKALQHLLAAELIAESSNFGLAFSHIVIGLEEWMKASILDGVMLGLIEIGKPDNSNLFRIPKKNIYSHEFKQFGAIFLTILLIPIFGRISVIMAAKNENREPTKDELKTRLLSDIERSTTFLNDFDKLEDMKQAGLYSGNRGPTGKLIYSAGKEDYEKFHNILKERLEIDKIYNKDPISSDFSEILQEDLEEFKRKIASMFPNGVTKK